MAIMKSIPAPGSPEAGELGCTCAVMDNAKGWGVFGDGGKFDYWINGNCPVHGGVPSTNDEEELGDDRS